MISIVPREPRLIRVWRFGDAPSALRALSRHGGDEDWLAVVPRGMGQPDWTQSGTGFAWCRVSEHPQPDGTTVYIGAHA